MSSFSIDAEGLDRIYDTVAKFADGSEAEKIINEELLGEGGDIIKQHIQSLLPASGRTFSGKRAAASDTDPFNKLKDGNLSVTITTKSGYGYLYFPDDGSDTVHHAGGQNFMFQGGADASEEVADAIINKLLEKFEED